MTISGNYPSPVMVNGFSCKNCTDVDYAKKHIDPAHPKDGPYGVDAKKGPDGARANPSPAVTFGGALAGLNTSQDPNVLPPAAQASAAQAPGLGARVDISA